MSNEAGTPPDATVFFIRHDAIGESSPLGYRLMQGLLTGLLKASQPPRKIILVNRGVFLACKADNVDVIEPLKQLAARGVEILSCGTCLEHFGLTQALQVGQVGSMVGTIETLTSGQTVVAL